MDRFKSEGKMGKMGKIDDEKICLCALNMIFGFEPRIAKALTECAGSAEAVFRMRGDELSEMTGPYSHYCEKINDDALEIARKELETAARLGICFIGRTEPGYPELLAECEDSPAGIYVRSRTPQSCLVSDRDYISIVGTRNVTPYGKDWCVRIVEALARCGKNPVIVSGLAYGTDITAHIAAMDCGLDTIAVMATGAESIYPAAHIRHAGRIAGTEGSALISDYPIGTKAIAINFIRRNRIIAGLSRATILIESKWHGGGMITAQQAFSYNRDVFALPGRASDIYSAGCNYLIRSGVASPVISEKDIVESLGYSFRKNRESPEKIAIQYYKERLSQEKIGKIAEIIGLVKKKNGISIQEIMDEVSMDYASVNELAGLLESDGFLCVDLMQRCSINFSKLFAKFAR